MTWGSHTTFGAAAAFRETAEGLKAWGGLVDHKAT